MTTTNNNPAFAFVVNSILNKNKNSKILSKAKKEQNVLSYENNEQTIADEIDFVDSQGKSIANNNNNGDDDDKIKEQKHWRQTKNNTIQRKNIDQQNIRTWLSKSVDENREKEKNLTLIATKGVVQLFNVVREKQKILKHKLNEAGGSESKRTKILTEFSEKEMQDERIKTSLKKQRNKKNLNSNKKKWPVLTEDFMTGARLKDWNEESDND